MAVKNKNINGEAPDAEVTEVQTETSALVSEMPVPVAEKPKAKASAEKAGVFAYIGPSIKNLIQSGTIYRGTYTGIIKNLEYVVGKYPDIKDFVVSGKTLAVDRLEIKKDGSLLNRKYNELAKMAG